jgi:hypothetical protein
LSGGAETTVKCGATTITFFAFGVLIALGAVIDATAHAIPLVPRIATYVGTMILVLGAVLAEILLRVSPLRWILNGTEVKVKRLGGRLKAAIAGMVLLLWLPVLLPRSTEHERAFHEKESFIPIASEVKERVALVIGNGRYRNWPLHHAAGDARKVATALQDIGFDVFPIINGDLATMTSTMTKFLASLGSSTSIALLYVTGHGIQVSGRNYLVPADAPDITTEDDVKKVLLDFTTLEDALFRKPKHHISVVIWDTAGCPTVKDWLSHGEVFFACSSVFGSDAPDNGVYAKHLVSSLEHANTSISQVFLRVREGVIEETRLSQTPSESSSLREDVKLRFGEERERPRRPASR